jgi:hypothetical protein
MSSATTGKRDGVVRIVPYAARQVGALRSAWVYTPIGARGGEALAVVYLLHGPGDGAAEWRAIDAANEMFVGGQESPPVEPAIVVIPISAPASVMAARRARNVVVDECESRAVEVFTDLMPLVERSFNVSADIGHRLVLVQTPPGGSDAFLVAVHACNLLLPSESRFRVIAAPTDGAAAPASRPMIAQVLAESLRTASAYRGAGLSQSPDTATESVSRRR